jgi:aminocarboxymuconate-semialdehyde decarboxylase
LVQDRFDFGQDRVNSGAAEHQKLRLSAGLPSEIIMPVIDIHTHMLTLDWIDLLRANGGKYSVKKTPGNQEAIHLYDAPFMTLMPGMWDYDMRIKNMDTAGVDIAVVSLTCPNVFWGEREVSLRAARTVNDSMTEQQRAKPDRIRWFASLPWQYAIEAKAELVRSVENGAVGVMVLGSIDGKDLIDPQFKPIWSEIDRLGLPALVHPTAPQGAREMHMESFNLIPPVGFMFDTTLAFAKIIFSGFLDKYPNLKLIAAHGGSVLPYLAGRLDICHEKIPACSAVIKEKPSSYLKRIYYDTVVYEQAALELCVKVAGSAENVLYGSDYPHNIGDMVGCLARVNALPARTAKMIAGKNAERIFKL